MKKLLTITLLFTLLFASACQTAGPGKETEPTHEEIGDLKEALSEMVEKAEMKDLLESGMLEEIKAGEAGFLIGAGQVDGTYAEAYSLQPMINVHPFAMGLFRLAEGEDPVSFASELKEKADLRKWICVEADALYVATRGQLVLFVMGSTDEVNAIAKAAEFTAVG